MLWILVRFTELIMEHSQSTHNRRHLEHSDCSERGHNPSCGDDIVLELKFDGDIIEEASFTGSGCAISQASTSMMTFDLISGRTRKEALDLVETFLGMIKRQTTNEEELEKLEDAIVLKNISYMPARVKCAVLAWHTLKEAINKLKKWAGS